MWFAGQCHRSKEELVSNLLLWAPRHGRASVGRPTKTYIEQLADNAEGEACDLEGLMSNRDVWRERIRFVRVIKVIKVRQVLKYCNCEVSI